jgi:2-polyprenyl-6-methoxyphenol hydroxylase-like FAD-dependent oxidoreductase
MNMQDPYVGVVTLTDDRTLAGDDVVAADGIRSNARPFVLGADAPVAEPTGESAYLWLMLLEDMRAMDSEMLQDDALPPTACIVREPMCKLVVYPIRGGTVLNFLACIREYTSADGLRTSADEAQVDAELHETTSEKWTYKGSPEAMVKSYEHYATL